METSSKMVTLNRQQFVRLVADSDGFTRLESEIGSERANRVAGLLFERQLFETNPDGRYIVVPRSELGNFGARISDIMAAECDQVTAKHAYAAKLLKAALEGKLSKHLKGAAEPDRDIAPARGRVARTPREINILKAGAWINQNMHVDRSTIVHELLVENASGPSGEVLGNTPELLDHIHARIFPGAPATRGPNPETSYPSSIGGRHLLETILGWTAEAVWPVPGDERWLDVALFYLGAIGTVQGYSDGNKRAARMAYAITLLRGRHPFIAPSAEYEQDLIQMQGPADGRISV